ncbi:hypothetical protein VU677_18795 [Hafnia paralvei]|uniref:hypothetical protein n=1 Tax=Hafnia paralvei TaxID=546367 RepID=UPI00300CDF38
MRRILAIAVRSVKADIRVPAKQAEERCQAGVLGGSDWPPNSDAGTMVMWNSAF